MKTKNENHNANVTNQNPPFALPPPLRESHRSPNGKVARLPAVVREIVNDMLYAEQRTAILDAIDTILGIRLPPRPGKSL